MLTTLRSVAAAAALFAATPALASVHTYAFTGFLHRDLVGGPTPPAPRCGPALTVGADNIGGDVSVGTSDFGTFLAAYNECIFPPPPTTTFDGRFHYDFASGDTLHGTRTSILSATATPGVFGVLGTWLVTGGTGFFSGATGSFTETGTFDRRGFPGEIIIDGTLDGTITTPEPELALMFGIGGAGLALVRPRRG